MTDAPVNLLNEERVMIGKILEAWKILYKSVKDRKIKEFLEEIKNGGDNGEYKRIQT